ncbi:LysR family substrate-binding domain-containing protein [Subtercola sp. YIM 133946]|uniref:LysR family substrate-binding domain-containing protein n=1 Tax=Subtercola sp. YIM 133946 TaxID=3118909 RepID=UPI002F9231BC
MSDDDPGVPGAGSDVSAQSAPERSVRSVQLEPVQSEPSAQSEQSVQSTQPEPPEPPEPPAQSAQSVSGEPASGPVLRIAFVAGVTVTKWTRVWQQRHPEVALEVFRSEPGEQTSVLHGHSADVSFVRHPVDRAGLSAIALYSEVPVVGVAKEHPASVFDEVAVADLAEEHLLQEPDEVPEWRDVAVEVADGSRRPLLGIRSLDDAFEQVAAGVGIVIVPKSIARLHSRKDVVYVPVSGVAEWPVSLAWREGDGSVLVEEFIGIVRGRSASSSRSGGLVDATSAGAAAATAAAGAGGGGRGRNGSADASTPVKKIGPVAKAKAKARAAREAEEAATGRQRPAQPARKKVQSEQANKAQARRRKFGGKR